MRRQSKEAKTSALQWLSLESSVLSGVISGPCVARRTPSHARGSEGHRDLTHALEMVEEEEDVKVEAGKLGT